MAATTVLSLPLAEASVKIRTGMPKDEPEDLGLDVWAGVLPRTVTWGQPQPDPLLREEIRMRLVSVDEAVEQPVAVRRQRASVERLPPLQAEDGPGAAR